MHVVQLMYLLWVGTQCNLGWKEHVLERYTWVTKCHRWRRSPCGWRLRVLLTYSGTEPLLGWAKEPPDPRLDICDRLGGGKPSLEIS